jgi:hypothetical protein
VFWIAFLFWGLNWLQVESEKVKKKWRKIKISLKSHQLQTRERKVSNLADG